MRICNSIEDGKAKLIEVSDDLSISKEAKLDWFDVNNLSITQKDGWGIPIASTSRVFCIGLNYKDHVKELAEEEPTHPTIFVKFPSSFSAHGQALIQPKKSKEFDFEGELVIVIGKKANAVSKDQALDHVFGYTIGNDGSIRDIQMRTSQWTAGKLMDRSGGLGPAIVTKDELPVGAHGLKIETRLNGQTVQSSNTDQLIFSVADIVSDISHICTLLPGDIIFTGTPAGVGVSRRPKLFMKAGDVCEVEIEGIGILKNTVTKN
jgi:2-keto-4-pentenoate hydratase/2-oxohepta-3-ene-1,7-dioic acid hydratase in catechol pathway